MPSVPSVPATARDLVCLRLELQVVRGGPWKPTAGVTSFVDIDHPSGNEKHEQYEGEQDRSQADESEGVLQRIHTILLKFAAPCLLWLVVPCQARGGLHQVNELDTMMSMRCIVSDVQVRRTHLHPRTRAHTVILWPRAFLNDCVTQGSMSEES